jgi:hypothetical protein
MATNNETTARESGGDNGLGLCPICKKGGKALVMYEYNGEDYPTMCCPDCSTKWEPCDHFEFAQAVSQESHGLLQECSWVVPEYPAGHPEELPRDGRTLLCRVQEMIKTLIVLENKGHSIGKCASRHLAVLKEWQEKARSSTRLDGKDALKLLEKIQRLIQQEM